MLCRMYFVLLTIILALGAAIGQAQDAMILTLSVPLSLRDAYDNEYFDRFRQVYPNVEVTIKQGTDENTFPRSPAQSSLDEYLGATANYVSTADVLFVTSWTITPESTRAGLWLDLRPLVDVDPQIDEGNFYPPAWRAFRWESGVWALPTTLDPIILAYNPIVFDRVGLSYPKADWTIDDYVQTSVTLTERDSNGNPIRPGCWCNIDLIFYGLLGHGLADMSGTPMLEDPELATLMEIWAPAIKEIYPTAGYSSESVPILIMQSRMLSDEMLSSNGMLPGELPSDVYGAEIEGFAISAGTSHPEQAFALVKYMIENPIHLDNYLGRVPALRYADSQRRGSSASMTGLSTELAKVLTEAAETAVVGIDLRYFDYVRHALSQMNAQHIDAMTALQAAQDNAQTYWESAANWTGIQPVVVSTPVPPPTYASGEIVLNFGIGGWNAPNQQDWRRLASDFAEYDPSVAVVQINFERFDYNEWLEENDCFYLLGYSVGPYSEDLYLPLDPLLDADPSFDPNDFVPGVLDMLKWEETTFGYPLSVQVSALRYSPAQFDEANIPLPGMNWSVSDFRDALNQLAHSDTDSYTISFVPRSTVDTDLLLLIAAYGGLPIDYRTDPPTRNFTDPDTIDAIRQVLDLVKDGLIAYRRLGTFFYREIDQHGAITGVTLSGSTSQLSNSSVAFVNYPQGDTYSIVSLGPVGGGYIKPETLHIEECYRWISFVSEHPELLNSVMPARWSAIEHPATLAAQGESAVALYREYLKLASAPNSINIPSNFGNSFDQFLTHQFLNRAFDDYVLDNVDLEEALFLAQQKTDDLNKCFNSIGPEQAENIGSAVEACIALVDPEMASERQEMMDTP